MCRIITRSFLSSVKLKLFFGILVAMVTVYVVTKQSSDQEHPTLKRNLTFNRVRPHVACARLIDGDKAEQRRAKHYQIKHPKTAISNAEYIEMTRDCDAFVDNRGYITTPYNEDEENFPLAFSLLVFKDVELFERLLRAVYRPQNVYCIHVDKKSASALHLAVNEIAGCFDNVFVLQNNVNVIWGTYSVMEPDILCMEALLKYKKWKYFINLTGQEFPLKTNWELVQILKVLNGSNLIGATIKRSNPERLAGRPPPPVAVTPFKGSVHIVARREFVEYAILHENGQKLLNWSKLIDHASEIFFSTLNHNPQLGIPGSYLGEPEYVNSTIYPFVNRLKIWNDHGFLCHGKYAHSICIFGVGDLPSLASSERLVANKFHLDYQPLALDCLEELILNRTQEELMGNRFFNTSYYQNLDVVRNHI